MPMQTLHDLFIEQLNELFAGEAASIQAMQALRRAASNPRLARLFEAHERESEKHAARLEDVGDGAIVIEELREEARRGLTDECARRMHRLSRMLERLSKRIDRVVTTPNASSRSGLHGFKPVLGM